MGSYIMESLTLKVNNRNYEIQVDPNTPLLYILRNDLELNGPKFGCGLGQCSACMVLLDGGVAHSCNLPVSSVNGREITTLEGLGSPENLHPVQKAFLEEQAMQCGYCINGMIIASKSLLDQDPNPDEKKIRKFLEPVLCRCGAHQRIINAVKRASQLISG